MDGSINGKGKMWFVKNQHKTKKKPLLLIAFLFLTTYLTFKTFKEVYLQDISIVGSELFSIEEIIVNSSLKLPTPLIFVKTKYAERELKRNLSLQNVSVMRQIYPFGLKFLIETRTPVAYAEKTLNGEKIAGFVDADGVFINEKHLEKKTLKNLSSKVYGWRENVSKTLSFILKSQKNKDVEFITISFSPNGFLLLEEKSLKTILLGFNSKIIKTQLQIISDMKKQLNGNMILEKIDNIDLTDPNNPKIKVFKP